MQGLLLQMPTQNKRLLWIWLPSRLPPPPSLLCLQKCKDMLKTKPFPGSSPSPWVSPAFLSGWWSVNPCMTLAFETWHLSSSYWELFPIRSVKMFVKYTDLFMFPVFKICILNPVLGAMYWGSPYLQLPEYSTFCNVHLSDYSFFFFLLGVSFLPYLWDFTVTTP